MLGDWIHSESGKKSRKEMQEKNWMQHSKFLRKERYSPTTTYSPSWSTENPNISYGTNQVQRRRTSLQPIVSSIIPREPSSRDNDNTTDFRRLSLINVQQPFADWVQFEDPYALLFHRWQPRYIVVDESGIIICRTDSLDTNDLSQSNIPKEVIPCDTIHHVCISTTDPTLLCIETMDGISYRFRCKLPARLLEFKAAIILRTQKKQK